ncbi:CMP-N-acetylneuraminate-beta-galactosamide-alpha-2,3-sialyltransferase 1-like isoform X4 [Ctenopharyngodon idella]|uniref:CMP-N-acetylneuraminate-beta-galactosamide- alpha-2,3-sialyltransferase 1-like isoform X3 n=1 Tax=Ctenopharyngodon idella TaxID=7959 RepID=UPI002232C8EE|nr:CMP-N-acetylneuraminate-beta-galactosamide-alpha-2,3-sialyltransferase 1-like isoform X3 [Ctenopharyngodon idella]XP_051728670.1 CMP-N-acetylneuraminate-beta-galactosamide-alpha-2,3-sialyltransferase 1-like isoform X4 [Ctenopharyngodon idella]
MKQQCKLNNSGARVNSEELKVGFSPDILDLGTADATTQQVSPVSRRGAKMKVLMNYRGSYMTAVITCVIIICMLLVIQTPMDEFSEGMCACKDCVRVQSRSAWFNELYDLSIQPLLTRENYVLSGDIYKYWKGLQKNKKESNYTVVVEKMFSLFPDKTQYLDASPKRCRTCAVVGNSGNLKGSRYGHRIDLHDFVIRINMGPTKSYEKDVGSKTTHRFIYPESAVDVENSTYLVLSPFKILDMEWLISAFTTKNITRTYKTVRPSINANRHKVMILHPAFIKYVHEIWLLKRGKYPSTGFLAIIFALHICDQVSTFGFGADQYGNWYHYFEKTSRNLRTGAHSGSFEFDTMMQLYLENKIQVFRGK